MPEYTVKDADGTAKSVFTDNPPTHCVIDIPGASQECVRAIQAKADVWFKTGGVLVVGGGSEDRMPFTVQFPQNKPKFWHREEWNGHSIEVGADTLHSFVELLLSSKVIKREEYDRLNEAFSPTVMTMPTIANSDGQGGVILKPAEDAPHVVQG